ncbi:MAG: hypothetical protein VYA67_21615 [Actinomycetota bacterium]|uniref:Uncharacterized protein n=1 Tax=Mycobacterium lentiflavum TaxID=141349 RepID=A0ABY3UUM2_MYCLN|nr:hypothetical protein [Mycobacterium lentiflavum]MEE3066505.1 hypothetical protein [Actinomycetota bacterium]ULP43268.1 hypothetical protein MJO58_04575 [Mycobacterium lentiflavum]
MNPDRITNLEIATADSYGLADMLGRRACSLRVIVVDRVGRKFSSLPAETISKLIDMTIAQLAEAV